MNQTTCLVNDKGHNYMNEYDCLPRDARLRLQQCKYNLCGFCVMKYAFEFGCPHIAIEYMVGTIDGKNMNYLLLRAPSNRYSPQYFDDREYKIKRDYFTQKVERYDPSYLIDPRRIYKFTDF